MMEFFSKMVITKEEMEFLKQIENEAFELLKKEVKNEINQGREKEFKGKISNDYSIN